MDFLPPFEDLEDFESSELGGEESDIARLRRESLRWRHWQTWTLRDRSAFLQGTSTLPVPSLPDRTLPRSWRGGGPLSESGVVTSPPTGHTTIGGQHYYSYREPSNRNTGSSMSIEAMEARCAQLRLEFANFRRRQAALEAQRRETRSVLSLGEKQEVPPRGSSRANTINITGNNSSDEFESAC